MTDPTSDVFIGKFASRFSEVFAKFGGKLLAVFQVTGPGSGGGSREGG